MKRDVDDNTWARMRSNEQRGAELALMAEKLAHERYMDLQALRDYKREQLEDARKAYKESKASTSSREKRELREKIRTLEKDLKEIESELRNL